MPKYSKTVSDKRVAEILRAARDKMNNKGKHWTQFKFKEKIDGEFCYCSVGGINAVTNDNKERNAAYIALADQICYRKLCARDSKNVIMYWNDHRDRTWDHVKEAFTKAARKASR